MILGREKTKCLWGTGSITSLAIKSANTTERLAVQDGQRHLSLHEKGRRYSSLHSGHLIRINPFLKMPQFRYFSISVLTTGLKNPYFS